MIARLLLILTISFFLTHNSSSQEVRFDGVYETNCDWETDDEEGEQGYLRFYKNGKVISTGTDCMGEASELKEWFTLENNYAGTGDYTIKDSTITFTTTSKVGSVEYSGTIMKNGKLKLNSKSFINGYEGSEEYHFVQIDGLK
ncbi:hypothetical protein [Ekhidna sp.]|uniref:hypothetical protein n=1 Tax=Ekhidna sp. TaxID=2608089 RepID=UPI003B59D6BC